MSPVAAVALGAVSQAKTLLALAQTMGWVRTTTDKSLERIDRQLRLVLEAPLHEGLDRVELAATVDDPRRQNELIREAQSKLHDAAVRPGMPSRVVAVACVTCASIAGLRTDADEAKIWVARALTAYDKCLQEAHRDASREALMDVGAKSPRTSKSWPKRGWSRVRRGASIMRACMRESSEDVRALSGRLHDINGEVAVAHAFASELGVPLDGHFSEVSMRSFKAVVVLVKLVQVDPARR